MQTRALNLLYAVGALVLVRRNHLLHFFGLDGEARRGGPDTVAFVVEDGGFVDVAGADEADGTEKISSVVGVEGRRRLKRGW